MIKLFRHIRMALLNQNKFSKYLLYALGEILLVVIGILIALQINNANDQRQAREKELNYLKNITVDLKINLLEMDNFLQIRNQSIQFAQTIIGYFEGEPITDYNAFNASAISIYNWEKFYQNDNTFQELINSGNLALISNDTIKNLLLDIQLLYTKMKSEEDHYRFDTEELIYKPLYSTMDLNPLVNNLQYQMSGGQVGQNVVLDASYFKDFFKNTQLKNGFLMTIFEFDKMNGQMTEMKSMTDSLIWVIDREMGR